MVLVSSLCVCVYVRVCPKKSAFSTGGDRSHFWSTITCHRITQEVRPPARINQEPYHGFRITQPLSFSFCVSLPMSPSHLPSSSAHSQIPATGQPCSFPYLPNRVGPIQYPLDLCTSWNIQFSSVAQSCLTLCDPMDHSMPGLPVHHQLPDFIQIHVHWVGEDIQPSHPLLSPPPPAFSLSQHQGLFQWVSSSHQLTKVLELQLQHQSFQWVFRTDVL